jgi:hypothetical protein
MLPISAVLNFATAALTTFNLVYADKPVEERRAAWLLIWRGARVVLRLLPNDDQQALKTAGIEI